MIFCHCFYFILIPCSPSSTEKRPLALSRSLSSSQICNAPAYFTPSSYELLMDCSRGTLTLRHFHRILESLRVRNVFRFTRSYQLLSYLLRSTFALLKQPNNYPSSQSGIFSWYNYLSVERLWGADAPPYRSSRAT